MDEERRALRGGSGPAARPAQPAYVYAADRTGHSLSQFRVTSDGGLSPLAPPAVPCRSPYALVAHPSGRLLYAASGDEGTVSGFRIGPDGGLRPLPGAKGVRAGRNILALALDPSGRFLYAADNGGGAVLQFRIFADGGPVPLAPRSIPVGDHPRSLGVDPRGRYLYVLHYAGPGSYAGVLSPLRIRVDGRLSPLPAVRSAPAGRNATSLAVHPSGRFAYAINSGDDPNTVSCFRLHGDGTVTTLTKQGEPLVAAGLVPSGASTITLSQDGRFAYVAGNADGVLYRYRVSPDGALRTLDRRDTRGALFAVAAAGPAGQHLFLGGQGRVLPFRQAGNPAAELRPLPPVPVGGRTVEGIAPRIVSAVAVVYG